MGRPRGTIVAACLVALTVLTACGKAGCTKLPVDSGIQIQVPTAIVQLVRTFRVELCQGSHCKAVNFARSAKTASGAAEKGISRTDDAYDLDLDRFGTGWKADTATGLTVLGTTKSGSVILKHTEQFTFSSAYPNGKDCDDSPELRFSTSLGAADITR